MFPQDGEGRHDLGVPVPGDDLGGKGLGPEAKPRGHVGLHLGGDVGVVAHGAREHGDPDGLPRPLKPFLVPLEGGEEGEEAEAEARGLGVDPVGAGDGGGVLVAEGEGL